VPPAASHPMQLAFSIDGRLPINGLLKSRWLNDLGGNSLDFRGGRLTYHPLAVSRCEASRAVLLRCGWLHIPVSVATRWATSSSSEGAPSPSRLPVAECWCFRQLDAPNAPAAGTLQDCSSGSQSTNPVQGATAVGWSLQHAFASGLIQLEINDARSRCSPVIAVCAESAASVVDIRNRQSSPRTDKSDALLEVLHRQDGRRSCTTSGDKSSFNLRRVRISPRPSKLAGSTLDDMDNKGGRHLRDL
jgi:hypothetical protein